MPELGSLGSVRGALSDGRPYREHYTRCLLPAEAAGYRGRASSCGATLPPRGAWSTGS